MHATPSSAAQQVAGVDDFDGDRHNDLVFWNSATGINSCSYPRRAETAVRRLGDNRYRYDAYWRLGKAYADAGRDFDQSHVWIPRSRWHAPLTIADARVARRHI